MTVAALLVGRRAVTAPGSAVVMVFGMGGLLFVSGTRAAPTTQSPDDVRSSGAAALRLRFSDISHARIETTVQSFLDDIATACGYGRSPSLVGIRL